MNWLDKLERKFGRLAIPRLMYYIVAINALVYFLMYLDKTGRVVSLLTLEPSLILKGEIWRLVTYVFIPPASSLLFIFFTLYFYYFIGNGLEQEWGSFKFNMYYLVGMIATTVAAFISGGGATGLYLNWSLLFAFAYLDPNLELLLFMVIPIKIKYLAWLNGFFVGYTVIFGLFPAKIAAIVSLANFLLFFGPELIKGAKRKRQVHENRQKFLDPDNYQPPIHVCEFCGMTERTDSQMVFTRCPECEGEYEYCTKHLIKHEHIRKH